MADELLLKLPEPMTLGALEDAVANAGGRLLGHLPRLRWARVGVDDARDAREHFETLEWPEAVTYSYVGRGGASDPAPDDTFFGSQYHLENIGQTGGTPGADVDVLAAWTAGTGSSAVFLAVLDTGIDFEHPEFLGRLESGFDFVNEDADPTADHSHGIHVTGIAAANTDNGFQVAGVDRACRIVPVKVLNQNNAGTDFDLADGIQYCIDEDVDVVNMSLINYGAEDASVLKDALRAARDAGCILISCSGNDGIGDADQSLPGSSPHTISIGATDHEDRRASFSGTGDALDFVAPGVDVVTVSTSHGDGFDEFTGCSAATPIAAGIVCLLLEEFGFLDQDAVVRWLREGAEDQVGDSAEDTPGWDPFHGHGRLNLRRSLEAMRAASEWRVADRFQPASAVRGSRFGSSLAVNGDRLLVGATHWDGATDDEGAVFVHEFDGSQWLEVERWQPFAVASGDHFGSTATLEGDEAVIGADRRDDGAAVDAGAAFHFRRSGGIWNEGQELRASQTQADAHFGARAALAWPWLAVSAPEHDGAHVDSGAVFLFEWNGTSWQERQILLGTAADQGFGSSLALADSMLIVGAPRDDGFGGDSGLAFHFEYDGANWNLASSFAAPDAQLGQEFGTALALSGERLVIGAPGDQNATGALYAFEFGGTSFVFQDKHVSSDAAVGGRLGQSVAVDGDLAIAGATNDPQAGTNAGLAHAFHFLEAGPVRAAVLLGTGISEEDRYGFDVAVHGTHVLVSSRTDSPGPKNGGSVWSWMHTGLDLASTTLGPQPGDTLDLRIVGGLPATPALLFTVEVDGQVFLFRVGRGLFDAEGRWSLTGPVPPELAGVTIGFLGIGFTDLGQLEATELEVVCFR